MAIVPTRREVEERIPAEYRQYAGIGPYYLPVFGRIYSKRLMQCLGAVRKHAGQPTSVLDVGCGFGIATAAMAEMYPRAQVRGLDLYEQDVLASARNLTRSSNRIDFVTGSIEDAPFESNSFDLVTAFDVLEHVPHPEVALREIARLLSPTGTVVASVPIESPILGLIRYVYLRGGRRGEIHPHWEGTFQGLRQFEREWRRHFTIASKFNAPFRFLPRLANYDLVLVGRLGSGSE
jgi:2-polyprenyl-3-methyl-5-hydroxy-6-metoxy-1,4-benzoquinol methylase